jgi:hypothetical protein
MTEIETVLRETFRRMDADQAQAIREAYYKAVEGLRALADAVEIADAHLDGPTNDHLMREHFLACDALTVMQKSELGRVL